MNGPTVAVAWEGLPVYGARLIAAGRSVLLKHNLIVLATRPAVPFENIESSLGQSAIWIERSSSNSWRELGLKVPEILVQTGWAYPHFNALASEVIDAGGRVTSMVDNRWKGNLRQLVGAFYFRLRLRRRFSTIWVPGASGVKLARFFGVSSDHIVTGLYGADPILFPPGPSLEKRPKRIIYVGQYVARKGVDTLAGGWFETYRRHPDWELVCYGSGPEAHRLRGTPGCRIAPFEQPTQISVAMRNARFLVLPSRDDHWGVVVHEAALSGCGLLVSSAVGAAEDLVSPDNGRVFPSGKIEKLRESLEWAIERNEAELRSIYATSIRMSARFGPDVWAAAFSRIVAASTRF